MLRLRPPAAIAALCLSLHFTGARSARAEDHVAYKWQEYQEENGRIRVISSYVGVEKKLTEQLALRAHGVHDAISGASPSGQAAAADEDLPLTELEDTRRAGVVDLDWTHGLRKTSFQVAYSKESDYLSRGFAVYNTSEYRKRNTGVSYGLSYVDDDIQPAFFDVAERKQSVDGYVGLSQVIDPNTSLTLNFTYGEVEGYLNDPYKIISKDTEVLPGLSLPLTFPENRPQSRGRRIAFLGLKRYVPVAKGSADVSYRYFNDTWSIESHTVDLAWNQKLGEMLVLRPSYRWYQQSGASFYFADLNEVGIDPQLASPEAGPRFSADYRLAAFEAETVGMKLIFNYREALRFDVTWTRYEMKGRDPLAPASAFPTATTLTLGGSWSF